ncbi:N-acetyltransferase family protein [Cohaesibacter sp. CAU 1516]|uniref:GNAT family N-acetyltransferase n=1 Tax=Cohaesibacter sp. CAU 1516 TaxID=2576038 RepID=UPI0010FD3D95|nr:GNAT family N-acetyltransferase [Cohaesibacter sp. CAU 1516]TLP44996.1 N-acetyltransferase family protein [Cohaesibacter sp. CAU 1516]
MKIRPATSADATAITAIYNDLVETSTAVWKTKLFTVEDRIAWIKERNEGGCPVLIAELPDGTVAGFATYGPWRAGDGYCHTVEHTVHVEASHRGQGIGKQLLTALIDYAKGTDLHVLIAGIEAENQASIKLHAKLGFIECGTMHQVGTKFGRWLDLTIMQLTLD